MAAVSAPDHLPPSPPDRAVESSPGWLDLPRGWLFEHPRDGLLVVDLTIRSFLDHATRELTSSLDQERLVWSVRRINAAADRLAALAKDLLDAAVLKSVPGAFRQITRARTECQA